MDAAQRVLRSRLGGYATAARHDGRVITERARSTYRDSFTRGHECAVCPSIELPENLSPAERSRRAQALRQLHYGRLAMRSSQVRSKKKPAPVSETSGAGQEAGGAVTEPKAAA